MSAKAWMIRAGRGGRLCQWFIEDSLVAVGWNLLAPLAQYQDKAAIKTAYLQHYPNSKPGKIASALGMLERFINIQQGDLIVSYCPKQREYLVGKDLGQYQYLQESPEDYQNIRKVNWLGKVQRDQLSEGAKRSLMSVLTVFSVRANIRDEFKSLIN